MKTSKREVPTPYKAREDDEQPVSSKRERIEVEEDMQDQAKLRMFCLFAEAVADLYTGTVDGQVRKTPAFFCADQALGVVVATLNC